MRRRLPQLLLVLPILLYLAGCGQEPAQTAELSGPTMGTSYSVRLSPVPDESTRLILQLRIDERLHQINRMMSTYIDDSDLERFNKARSTDWLPVPAPLAELVERGQSISAKSGGSYDITVGPLVALWGFGNAGQRDAPPSADAIAQTLRHVGYRRLETRLSPPALRKAVGELEIDLSSIAKGWAVDQIAELLQAQGIDTFLVEVGGETRAQGLKEDGQPWRIAVERPLFTARDVQGRLLASDIAIATSGDYRNYFEYQGERFSHTIDPVSGQTVRNRLASVTVLADNCTDADAWATALMALGEHKGPALAESLGMRALFIVRDGDRLREQLSPALANSALWQTMR